MYRYIQFADTYTYRQIHTYTCIYMQIQDMNTYAFLVIFICVCIVHVYTSTVHANMKLRFNMNTYDNARSLMPLGPAGPSGRADPASSTTLQVTVDQPRCQLDFVPYPQRGPRVACNPCTRCNPVSVCRACNRLLLLVLVARLFFSPVSPILANTLPHPMYCSLH